MSLKHCTPVNVRASAHCCSNLWIQIPVRLEIHGMNICVSRVVVLLPHISQSSRLKRRSTEDTIISKILSVVEGYCAPLGMQMTFF